MQELGSMWSNGQKRQITIQLRLVRVLISSGPKIAMVPSQACLTQDLTLALISGAAMMQPPSSVTHVSKAIINTKLSTKIIRICLSQPGDQMFARPEIKPAMGGWSC